MSNNLKSVLNEDLIKKLLSLDTAQQVQDLLKQNGIDLSLEQIEQVKDLLVRRASNQLTEKEAQLLNKAGSGELDENELANVAGGLAVITEFKVIDIVNLFPTTQDAFDFVSSKNTIKNW